MENGNKYYIEPNLIFFLTITKEFTKNWQSINLINQDLILDSVHDNTYMYNTLIHLLRS